MARTATPKRALRTTSPVGEASAKIAVEAVEVRKLRVHALIGWWYGPLAGSLRRARHSVPVLAGLTA